MKNSSGFEILDNLMEGCQIIGFDLCYLYVNDAAASQVRKSKEELLGRTVMDVHPGIEKTPMFSTLKQCLAERKPIELENEFIYEDGSTAWFLLKMEPVSDGLLILSIDITKFKRMEENLHQSEALLSKTGEIARVGGWELDLETNTLRWTPETYRIHEVDPTFVPDVESAINFYAPEARPIIAEAVQQGIDQGKSWDLELPFITAKGNRLWVYAQGQAEFRDGKCVRLFGVFQDITARKQLEEQLRQSRERITRILSSVNEVVWAASLDGSNILDVTDSLEKVYGYSVEDFKSNPKLWLEVVHPEDRAIAEESGKELLSRGSAAVEYRIVRPDGEIRWLLDHKSVIKDADGNPAYIGGLADDITDRKQAEIEALKHLQRLKALREIDLAIVGTTNLSLTLKVILEQVVNLLPLDAADILLLNPHSLTLEFAAGRGFRTSGIEKSKQRLGQGHAGRAAMEHQMILIPDLNHPPEPFLRAPLIARENFVFYCAIPLVGQGNLIGTLEVFHRSPFHYDEDKRAFLQALAGQASIAIENSRLFSELKRATMNLLFAYDETIEGWSKALDLRDKETEGHTQRVTEMTIVLARAMGIPEDEIVHIRRGALLHDIGKMGVPDAILLKPDKLTDEEWVIMRKHPVFAYEWLHPIEYLRPALDIPYCHHEKCDGTGYPRGLKGEEIPLAARIFAVVDVWDALTSDRPYRKAWSQERVLEHIREQAGTHFDPNIVELFFKVLREKA